jgi:rfaE bifunctional protein nucleotidyltransferase chain/domain
MDHFSHLSSKIYNLEALKKQVNSWKDNGMNIVFTNGCFDILHRGHITYLNQAASLGDKLIVGVNTDASVGKIKGKARPIQDEQSRLYILAALECVAAVFLFDEDTPLRVISELIPDILVKGADYEIKNIVGADIVMDHGGEVKTIPFIEGYSTSAIEKKIIESSR